MSPHEAADVRSQRSTAPAAALLALALSVLGCGPGPTPSATEVVIPPPRTGASGCRAVGGDTNLITQLTAHGIVVTAVSGSTGEALFPAALSVCLMDVGTDTFEVAYFADEATAADVQICPHPAGGRFLYEVDGHTLDAAFPIHWTLAGDLLLWTNSNPMDLALGDALGGTRPHC